MCLIAVVPPRAEREPVTDQWLADIYKRNDDGFGFMWHTRKKGPQTYKAVGKVADFIAAYRQMERHANGFAVHVRMATHGKVEQAMSHPYPVDDQGQLYMMHNGILACGNTADASKSDTWHYINDVIRPMYEDMGTKMFKDYMLELIGEAIGNNRFVFIDKEGKLHIVNEHQGLTWSNMWLSNTYAWPASSYGVKMPRYGRSQLWDYDDDYVGGTSKGKGLTVVGGTGRDAVVYGDEEDTPSAGSVLSWTEANALAEEFRVVLVRAGYVEANKELWTWEITQAYLRSEQDMEDLEAALEWHLPTDVLTADMVSEADVIEFVRHGTLGGEQPVFVDPPIEGAVIGDLVGGEEEDTHTVAIIDGDEQLRKEINQALGEGMGHDRYPLAQEG